MPTPRDTRKTQRNLIPLSREKYWRIALQLRTTKIYQIKEKSPEILEKARAEYNQFQEIRKALQRNQKELQGVALGICQCRENLLWYNN